MKRYWAVICNPSQYDIEGAVQELSEDTWNLSKGDPQTGDGVVFWKAKGSEQHRGVVALGEVIEAPRLRREEEQSWPFWREEPPGIPERRMRVRYIVPPRGAIWLEGEHHDLLASLTVSNGQGNKLYHVTAEQWDSLKEVMSCWEHPFEVGQHYTKNDIYGLLDVPQKKQGGNWNTGYHHYEGIWYIFANVGIAGRTGHNYANGWFEGDFHWTGRTSSKRHHPTIQALTAASSRVLLFWRDGQREPFYFAGQVFAAHVEPTVPVGIVWRLFRGQHHPLTVFPNEIRREQVDKLFEGSKTSVIVNRYERNPLARKACVEHYGAQCFVCKMTFANRYGEFGEGFIHIHHLKPLSEITERYEVDPIEDLRPVCPNCHAMLHKRRPPLSIDELRAMLRYE